MKRKAAPKREPVANLYAKALFEFASERKVLDAVADDLAQFRKTLDEQPDLMHAMSGFMFPPGERIELSKSVAAATKLHPDLARFVDLLIVKGRLQLLPAIHDSFVQLLDESRGVLRGKVLTAVALSDQQSQDLAKTFSKKFNKNVILEPVLDKSILGGLVVRIEGKTFDGSLQTTIRRLKEDLLRGSA